MRCYTYPDAVLLLETHLFLADSDALERFKNEQAQMAFQIVVDELTKKAELEELPPPPPDPRNSRWYESEDGSDDDDYHRIPSFPTLRHKDEFHPNNPIEAVHEEFSNETRSIKTFADALLYCYPATYHLMCNGWVRNNKGFGISYCPLCPSMAGWREHHDLHIDKDALCISSNKKHVGARTPARLIEHLNMKSHCVLNKIIMHYLLGCVGPITKLIPCWFGKEKKE